MRPIVNSSIGKNGDGCFLMFEPCFVCVFCKCKYTVCNRPHPNNMQVQESTAAFPTYLEHPYFFQGLKC